MVSHSKAGRVSWRRAAHTMVARKQRVMRRVEEGEKPFRVVPPVTTIPDRTVLSFQTQAATI